MRTLDHAGVTNNDGRLKIPSNLLDRITQQSVPPTIPGVEATFDVNTGFYIATMAAVVRPNFVSPSVCLARHSNSNSMVVSALEFEDVYQLGAISIHHERVCPSWNILSLAVCVQLEAVSMLPYWPSSF